MTRLLLATVAAATLAAPTFAETQIERSLGVEAGTYSAAELARKHFARSHETGDGPRPTFGTRSDVIVSTSNQVSDHAERALRHFAQDYETGDGPRIRIDQGGSGNVVISTSNSDLAEFARAKLYTDDDRPLVD